jgi:hypothetical protein
MSTASRLPRPDGVSTEVASAGSEPCMEDDDDLPLGDPGPNWIPVLFYTADDIRRFGVPDSFIRKMRRTGTLPVAGRTAGGKHLFEPRHARDVLAVYLRAQANRRP